MNRKGSGSLALAEALQSVPRLDALALRRAVEIAAKSGESLVSVIHDLGLADDDLVVMALSEHYNIPCALPCETPSRPVAIDGVSVSFLLRHRVLPLGWRDGELLVGVVDPSSDDGLAGICFAVNTSVVPRLMAVSAQKRVFEALYDVTQTPDEAIGGSETDWNADYSRVRDQTLASPAVRFVDTLLERAVEVGASDIRIEPLSDRVRVRLRIDGRLQAVREEHISLGGAIAARVKILANMDVADRRRAQDGRTSLAVRGVPIDVRVSSVPAAYGETIAMRLLRRDSQLLDLDNLGFSDEILAVLERLNAARGGLFAIVGPTGSGKTTTLYAIIERLRAQALKIISIEDPIEYYFPDVTQVQVNQEAGVTFASALRAFLRQDPDVILVGEIRDSETAKTAVQAALTGHLVLATLHTSDAAQLVDRLVDMGVDRYLVSATLTGVVAQRLVRRLCQGCRRLRPPNPQEMRVWADAGFSVPTLVAHPVGCVDCGGEGYLGRATVAEGYLADDEIRAALSDPSGSGLVQTLRQSRFVPMACVAEQMARNGEISAAAFRMLTAT